MTPCEEQIAGEGRVREGRVEPRLQDCGLPAAEWCATCRRNVCTQHVTAWHLLHTRTHLPPGGWPADEPEDRGERRSGRDRRRR